MGQKEVSFFTKHLRESNESYISHLKFAGGAGLCLLSSAVYYLVHSVFPFVPIPKGYCIETIKERSKEWHDHISNRGEEQ